MRVCFESGLLVAFLILLCRMSINKGYVEFRAKFPRGDRVWPAVWMIADDLVWGPEWDIFEYFGSRDVGKDIMGNHLATGTYVSDDDDLLWDDNWLFNYDAEYTCEDWHTYGFVWTDTRAVFLIDEEVVTVIKREESHGWPEEKMYFVLNNGVKTSSPRGFSENTEWPNYLIIDYFKVYEETAPISSTLDCSCAIATTYLAMTTMVTVLLVFNTIR